MIFYSLYLHLFCTGDENQFKVSGWFGKESVRRLIFIIFCMINIDPKGR